MSVPLRPDHAVSRREQLRRRLEAARERLQFRRRMQQPTGNDMLGLAGAGSDSGFGTAVQSERPLMPGVIAGALVALLGLSAVWGWQTWSARVSVPIDDRLPLLVATEQSDDLLGEAESTRADPASTDQSPQVSQPPESPATQLAAQPPVQEPVRVVVHVSGAVERAGVVELEPGARVVDALRSAGGAAAEADLDRVNLAAVVLDGERIHVPARGEDSLPVVVAPSRPSGAAGTIDTEANDAEALLDVNSASAEALEALPGVGPAIAQAIVRTRVSRGPFMSVDELLDVPGIGESKLAQIAPFVMIGS